MLNWFSKFGKTTTSLANELRTQGPLQFSNWDSEAFDSYLQGPLANLKQSLEIVDQKQRDHSTLENFTRIVYQGVGAGWLKTIHWERPAPTFLAHCLSRVVPYQLRHIEIAKRADALSIVWNLGEGMAHEAPWLNQYAISQTPSSTSIDTLQQHLEAVLEPVLTQPETVAWSGSYHLNVIHLREISDGFLPGRLFLASPAVLCIENELDDDETIGILLRRPQQYKVLGNVGRLPEHIESFAPPSVELLADAIKINETSVAAELLSSPFRSLATATGFVAVSAEDSQRLWLVEVA